MEIPKTLDWVKARSECSIDHMFMLLREVIDSDVKSIQSVQPDIKYAIHQPSDGKVVVSRQYNAGGVMEGEAVVFERLPEGIRAKEGRTEKQILVATPSLQPDGECKLQVGGVALELWQISKSALEGLFFRS